MRGNDEQQLDVFSYVSPEQRVPQDHPLRSLRVMTDEALRELQPRFNRLYATIQTRTRAAAGHDRVTLPKSDRAPRHHLYRLNGALRAIALGVCDYLAETTGCPTQLARISLEGSIIGVVEDMFKEGLAHHGIAPGVDGALLATTAAWAVFGAARRWFQTRNRISAEEMAARIETTVTPVLFGS